MKEIIINIIFNLKRNRRNWLGLVISLIILPGIVLGYLSFFHDGVIGKIAVSNVNADTIAYFQKNNILYQEVNGEPEDIYKVSGDYLGYIAYHPDGSKPDYETYIGSETLIQQIANETYSHTVKKQDVFTNLFPTVIVVMFLEAVLNMKPFIDDRQNGLIVRQDVIGLKKSSYVCAMLLYNAVLLFVPLLLSLFIGQEIFGVDYGYSGIQVCVISAVMSLVGSLCAFALCSMVRRNDSAILVGNIVAVMSTLLSGVFGNWKGFGLIGDIMPQRILLEWITVWKQNGLFYNIYAWYLAALIILLFLLIMLFNQRFLTSRR